MATLLKPSIIRPEHKVTQDEMIQMLQTLFPEHPDWKQAEAMIRNSQIQQRYIVRPLAECVTNSGFDSPSVINGPQLILNACNTDTQFELVGGNFFEKIDAKGDAIIMKHILHDWDEESCLKILHNCHTALPKNGKLLVVEMVIPGPNQPAIGKWLDLQMLVFMHSCERTEEEYSTLFTKAEFRLTSVFPSMSPFSVIEAVRL